MIHLLKQWHDSVIEIDLLIPDLSMFGSSNDYGEKSYV